MAATEPQVKDHSHGLSLSLSSNNPFRNRAGSPLPKSPASPFDDPSPQLSTQQSRPVSNNPFLDPSQKPTSPAILDDAPLITMADENATKPKASAEDLLSGLSLDDKEKDKGKATQSPPTSRRPPPRGENVPPGARRGPPPPGHRSRGSGPGGPNSPPRRMPSRGPERPLTDEEKKERERKRREYERKRREAKSSKPKDHKHADLIDELDESSPLGRVHHGGPYDAIIAARNKPTNRHAPINAFAKDSANMSIGGSGPLNARADHSTFMGKGNDEAFNDYGISLAPPTKKDIAMFDPHARVSVIHGEESVGLGTSTFLEGTPAAKAAVEKAEQENAMIQQDAGLARKKSLAQRIRGMNGPRREYGSGRMTNPEGVYYRDRPSAGSMSSPRGENNPFFAEYEPGKDGEEQISVRKMSASGGPSSPPVPGNLERRSTTDGMGGPEPAKPKTGLLGRMKSLKGGPRSRPVDRDYGNAA